MSTNPFSKALKENRRTVREAILEAETRATERGLTVKYIILGPKALKEMNLSKATFEKAEFKGAKGVYDFRFNSGLTYSCLYCEDADGGIELERAL